MGLLVYCCSCVVICEDGRETKNQVVIKYFIKKDMKANEIQANYQNTPGTLLLHIELFPSGQMSLNVARRA